MDKTQQPKRYRLAVFRSNKHIYAQIIDDEKGITLTSVSDQKINQDLTPIEKAKIVGQEIAKQAQGKKIKDIFFDRRKRRYHGKIKALAESARKNGLNF